GGREGRWGFWGTCRSARSRAAEAPGAGASEKRGVASLVSATSLARQPVLPATRWAKPTRSLPMARPADAPVARPRRARSVHERNTVDLFQRRLSGLRFRERGLPERHHALLHRRGLQIDRGLAIEDHLADRGREVEQLGDRGAAAVPGAVAVLAPRALEPAVIAVAHRVQPGELEQLGLGGRLAAAARADHPHQ